MKRHRNDFHAANPHLTKREADALERHGRWPRGKPVYTYLATNTGGYSKISVHAKSYILPRVGYKAKYGVTLGSVSMIGSSTTILTLGDDQLKVRMDDGVEPSDVSSKSLRQSDD